MQVQVESLNMALDNNDFFKMFFCLVKHPEECGEMEIAEKDVAVAPDLDDLLGLLSELFYPQYKGLKNKV